MCKSGKINFTTIDEPTVFAKIISTACCNCSKNAKILIKEKIFKSYVCVFPAFEFAGRKGFYQNCSKKFVTE